ncbi:phosphatase 2C-like domain-containing protein [Jimgerdemannia flammicorona]|uniref:Protein phosphatase n=1 Tax=Jimgerdemannia flammicorona TaxID=994334 RepID=A0A433PCK6_9FUNG|nr:phosphatase 2C-like domain-containing protein [Jimgerdemannia flammicorona]
MFFRSISASIIAAQRPQLLRLWTRSLLPAIAFKPSLLLSSTSLFSTSHISHNAVIPVAHLPQHDRPRELDSSPLASTFDLPASLRPATPSPTDDPTVCIPNPAVDEHFEFITSASWHPKYRKQKSTEAAKIPYWKHMQVGKVDAGDDAFFHTSTPKGLVLGVADGVGGWAEVGVDPALFSWTLMNNAASIAKKIDSLDAQQILDGAFTELVKGGKVTAGSSTACILGLCKATGQMTSSNLGDSAFILIRDHKVIYESPSQQHFFNCPYQLTVVPENYPNRNKVIHDQPKDAQRHSFSLEDGDLILLATDGFFDNVFAYEALAIINHELAGADLDHHDHHTHSRHGASPAIYPPPPPAPAQPAPACSRDAEPRTEIEETEELILRVRSLCRRLTDTARRFSLDPKRMSPWAQSARMHGGKYLGGKEDDITCIVTLVRNTKP